MTGGPDIPRSGSARLFWVVNHLPSVVRLCWRLFRDGRVSPWPKVFLAAALAYVVLPFDLVPDSLPVLGQLDDLGLVVLAAYWFVRWCPPPVVREHAETIGRPRMPGRAT